jgi:beta-barrel assembly-enhancing protease
LDTDAQFLDGETARQSAVRVRYTGTHLEFEGGDTPFKRWSIRGLRPIDLAKHGQGIRLAHDSDHGSRLVIQDQKFIVALTEAHTHLAGKPTYWRMSRTIGQATAWFAAGLAVIAALGWLALTYLPAQVAGWIPDKLRNETGKQVVSSLVGTARKCDSVSGQKALAAMVAVLAEGNKEMPPVLVEVYDIPIMNAFAAPGGRVVITKELIEKAETPEEVAGVFAHELGHVALLHPEQQLVRLAGVQVLISALTGGGFGEYLGGVAGYAALLRHSRDAERDADAYAIDLMQTANVDPTGLKRFFEKVMRIEGASQPTDGDSAGNATLEKLGDLMATHPDTQERIKAIVPLPEGKTPVAVMTGAQWQALRAICN